MLLTENADESKNGETFGRINQQCYIQGFS